MIRRLTGITFVQNRIEELKAKTRATVERTKEKALHGGVIVLALGSIIWLSIFIYIIFYYTYIPPIMHSKPIFFQFQTCENDANSKVCSFLSSHVELTKKQQLLMVGQKYSVTVELELPESDENRQQGMFLVCVELTSADRTLLAHGCRSTMLRYASWLLRSLRTAFFIPAYMLGYAEEKQTIKIEVIPNFVDDGSRPVTDAYVEIRSRRVQVYSARLHMAAHFSGLRHVMYHWPTVSGIGGVGLVLGTLLMLIGLSWHQVSQGDGLAARATRHLTQRLAAFVDEEDLEYTENEEGMNALLATSTADACNDDVGDDKDVEDKDGYEEFSECGPPNVT